MARSGALSKLPIRRKCSHSQPPAPAPSGVVLREPKVGQSFAPIIGQQDQKSQTVHHLRHEVRGCLYVEVKLTNADTTEKRIRQHAAATGNETDKPALGQLLLVSRWRDPGSWRREVAVVLGCYLSSRIAVLLTAKIATWYAKPLTVGHALNGWDGGWYLSIARDGYPSRLFDQGGGNQWAFFPGLPSLVRLVHATGLSYQMSGMTVSFLAGMFAGVGVYLAVRTVLGGQVGSSAAVLFVFLPNSYVLSMTYTEGLFVACSAFCLYFLVTRRWDAAGLVALLGGFIRFSGVVLIACCAFEALRVAARERTLRPLTAPVLAPLGLIAFMAYADATVDDPVAFNTAQQYWHNSFDWFRPVWRGLDEVVVRRGGWQDAPAVMTCLALVCVVIGFVALVRTSRVPSVWWIYSVLTVLLGLTPFWLTSVPRYMLPAFPLYAAVMAKLPDSARLVVVSASAVVMGALALGAFVSILSFRTAPMAP